MTDNPTPPQPITATRGPGRDPGACATPHRPRWPGRSRPGRRARAGPPGRPRTTSPSGTSVALGEGGHAEPPDQLRRPPRRVGARRRLGQADLAQHGLARQAPEALPARRHPCEHHVVAHAHAGDRLAHLGHHAGPLVAEHGREHERHRPVLHRQVGVTHPARRQLHPDVAGPGRGELDRPRPSNVSPTPRDHRGPHRPARPVTAALTTQDRLRPRAPAQRRSGDARCRCRCPERSTAPGRAPVKDPARTISVAVHEHVLDPDRPRRRAGWPPRAGRRGSARARGPPARGRTPRRRPSTPRPAVPGHAVRRGGPGRR